MNQGTEKAAAWVYRGIWRGLSDCFKVPQHPPTLPVGEGEFILNFHPSRRYLSYIKLYFWIALCVLDGVILLGWTLLFVRDPQLGMLLAGPALVVALVPDILAYVAIHLRYDTMWYVMSDRSLRCRRGIWVILEHTITFENVQNVHVDRGPLQYLFGISTITVETAGSSEGEENEFAVGNKTIMEGIGNPDEIRGLIMERAQSSTTAGLGDESPDVPQSWTRDHVRVLREIVTELRPAGRV